MDMFDNEIGMCHPIKERITVIRLCPPSTCYVCMTTDLSSPCAPTVEANLVDFVICQNCKVPVFLFSPRKVEMHEVSCVERSFARKFCKINVNKHKGSVRLAAVAINELQPVNPKSNVNTYRHCAHQGQQWRSID